MAYHILLVDDAPELRRMVGELLELSLIHI